MVFSSSPNLGDATQMGLEPYWVHGILGICRNQSCADIPRHNLSVRQPVIDALPTQRRLRCRNEVMRRFGADQLDSFRSINVCLRALFSSSTTCHSTTFPLIYISLYWPISPFRTSLALHRRAGYFNGWCILLRNPCTNSMSNICTHRSTNMVGQRIADFLRTMLCRPA